MKFILTIDGGGIRGLIPAIICEHLQEIAETPIAQLFDMIAGTSTGGILALGYAIPSSAPAGQMPPRGIPPSADALVALYEQHGGQIFSNPRNLSSWFRPKYQPGSLVGILKKYFGNYSLEDATTEVLIPTYDLQARRQMVVKTWQAKSDPVTHNCKMWEVARAASAAPTFFEPATITERSSKLSQSGPLAYKDSLLVDGGLVANNPSLLAFVEAKRQWKNEELFVVSLSSGHLSTSILVNQAAGWGKAKWAYPVIEILFDASSSANEYMMRELLPEGHYWRFDIGLTPCCANLDDVSAQSIAELKRLAKEIIYTRRNDLRKILTQLHRARRCPHPLAREVEQRFPKGKQITVTNKAGIVRSGMVVHTEITENLAREEHVKVWYKTPDGKTWPANDGEDAIR